MTNTNNQDNNINQNSSTIHLGECKTRLIEYYNISKNDSLYILKIDVKEKGMKIPKVEYEVLYPLNDTELIKLNLTICHNLKIGISLPINIDEKEIYKYNLHSDYYNDICLSSSSENGVDISLSDKRNQFINNNMTLCEEDCFLVQYNPETKRVHCSCFIKTSLPNVKDIKFDNKKLYKSFIDIKNIANINLMKCYKKVFTKDNLKNNYGFFIYIFIFILYAICLLLFCFKYYSKLLNKINDLAKLKKELFEENNINNLKITDNKIILCFYYLKTLLNKNSNI